jgi:D-amino-acid dehydrogenase
MLAPLGIRIPVYPVKGYSITVPITDAAGRPSRPSWTRPTRWRSRAWATASASAARPSWPATPALHEARRRTLEHVVTDLFPQGGDVSQAEFWCGLRPMTPDGTPIVGGTRYPTSMLAPATARWAGPWPRAPAASWPT